MMAAMSRAGTPSDKSDAAAAASCAQAQSERMHIVGLIDLVAERDRLAGAQPQKIARRHSADDSAGLVNHAEMADFQPVHAPDGAIDESVGGNDCERLVHELLDRHRERGRAMLADARGARRVR